MREPIKYLYETDNEEEELTTAEVESPVADVPVADVSTVEVPQGETPTVPDALVAGRTIEASSLPVSSRKTKAIVAEGADTAQHAVPPAKRRNFMTRVAMALGPFYSLCYDLQMWVGGGVREVRHRLQLPGTARSMPKLRAAFLSDFHFGPTSGRVAARQAWNRARDFEPDLLLLGGDYFYGDARGLPLLLRELERWQWNRPKAGIYAIMGNHDYKFDPENVIASFEKCGVRVLRNEAVQLPHPWDSVWISGLDDIDRGTPDIEAALAHVPADACSIMVAHSPDVCAYGELKRCALTLCGDTHGGQIAMPSGDPVVMSSEWGKHFPHGLHRHNGNWVFVSRGIGTVTLPIRMFAPPDVGLFEIAGSSAGVLH
jgi:predicted MPP superfamily phosphohydrolase